MITLFYFHPASSMASHITLEESGLEYEARCVNIADENSRATLLAVNPGGFVPTLVVDDQTLTENVAILSYIARSVPTKGLMPEAPLEYAQCLSMLAWCATSVHTSFRMALRPERFSNESNGLAGIRARGREQFWAALQMFDARLASRPFIMGENFTVADAYSLVFYNWGLLGKFPVVELQNFSGLKDRLLERPAVRTVLQREGCTLT